MKVLGIGILYFTLFFCFSYGYSGNDVQLQPNVYLFSNTTSLFGIAVGLSNTTLVVGDVNVAAYVFLFDSVQNEWGLQGTLSVGTASLSGSNYASEVAIYGDHVMVAASTWSESSSLNRAGTVFAFMRNGPTWESISQIDALDPSSYSYFGSAVSLSGNTVLIGAMRKDNTGAAYVAQYTEDDGWTVSTKIVPTDGGSNDLFGSSVCLDGNVAVVGSPNHSPAGAVYIFQLNTTLGVHMVTATLKSPDVTATYFGYAVAVSGSTVVVGSYGYDQYRGIAYVYVLQGNTWELQGSLLASDGVPGDFFGVAVDVNQGSGIIVGAAIQQNFKNSYAYVYNLENGQWNEQERLSFNGSAISGDRFGWSVSLDGYVAAIGAPDIDSAFVYTVLCPSRTYGPTCSSNCSCPATGVCSSGITGDGTCKSCLADYFGRNCTNRCTCQNGTCDNNPINGLGKCSSCSSDTFGPNCNQPCKCPNGVCDNNPTNGTGQCLSCFSPYYGLTCSSQCTCSNGLCDTSTSGKGECLSCNQGYYGSTCGMKCKDVCLTCSDGVYGNGSCLSCAPGVAGPSCNISCPHGCTLCHDGIHGDGTCTQCPLGTWGPTCAQCTCVLGRGKCNPSTGECTTCNGGYWGSTCSELCLCRTNPNIFCFDGPTGNGTCIVPITPVNPPPPPPPPITVEPAPEEEVQPAPSQVDDIPAPQTSGAFPLQGVWVVVMILGLVLL